MTPRRLIRALGPNTLPAILALAGSLALLALVQRAGFLEPGALLELLLGRYEDFTALTFEPVGPFVAQGVDWTAARLTAEPAPAPSGLWRDVFIVGALVAFAFAMARFRTGVLGAMLSGALGLIVALIVAVALDVFAGENAIAPAVVVALIAPVALVRLILGYMRAAHPAEEGAGRGDPQVAIYANWTVLAAVLVAVSLALADASDYSETLAAALWLAV